MKDWVDFKAVKEAVSIEMVIEHYGLELRKVNASTLRGKCPLPSHVGESENSLNVNTQKNAWACHAASCVANRGGRKGGNLLDFVAFMENCSIRDAALKLQNWFSVAASNERPAEYTAPRNQRKSELIAEKNDDTIPEAPKASESDAPDAEDREVVNQPIGFALKSVDTSHPYLHRRGIKEETAKHFGVGFFHGKGSMAGRVVIPIHNEQGELIAYAGRAIDESEPKYKLPTGFHKSLVLFNLHRVLGTSREVIIVEGYFDAMKVHQAGFPGVVALMGSALSEQQEKLLTQNFDSVVVMLDNDKGGNYAATQIVSRLMDKVFLRLVHVPQGKQPDQIASEEIKNLLAFLNGGDDDE